MCTWCAGSTAAATGGRSRGSPAPTSGCCGCRSRTAGASSTSSASAGDGARGADRRSAEPGAGGRSLRRELGGAHARLRAAGVEPAARRARPVGSRRFERREPRPSARRATSGSTCRRGTTRRGPIRWWSIHDGDDFVDYAELPVVLDNLIEAGRDPAGDRGAGADPRPARGIFRRPAARRASSSATSCRRSRRAGGSREAPRDRVLLGASLGAVASLATAFRYPGVFGGLVLKSGSFILDERKLERRPHPVFHRIARLMRALRRAPPLPRHARLRLDRRARGAGRREPGACKLLARTRRRCFVQERVGRPPLAQLARPAPRRAAVGAAAGRRPDRLTGRLTPVPASRGERGWASVPSTSACRLAPTSAGRSPTRACSRRSTRPEARPRPAAASPASG